MRPVTFLMAALFVLGVAPLTAQTTFTVTSAKDVDDGTCNATHCRLLEAINAANANVGGTLSRSVLWSQGLTRFSRQPVCQPLPMRSLSTAIRNPARASTRTDLTKERTLCFRSRWTVPIQGGPAF